MINAKKANKLVWVTICLAVLVVGANLVRMNIVKKAMEQGENAYDQEDYGLAITNYTRAIKFTLWEKETKADSFLWRGRAYYYGESNFDLSIADFSKAIKLCPDDYAYYLWRGRAYHQIKNYDLAITDFTEAIKIDSDSSYYGHNKFVERGDVYVDKGDYKLAIDDYDLAIAEIDGTIARRNKLKEKIPGDDWDNSELYQWRSDIEQKLTSAQREQKRQKYVNAVPGTREYRAEEHYKRGLDYAYYTDNKTNEKKSAIEELLSFFSGYPGNLDMAIKEWEEALRIDPNHDYAKECLEEARVQRGY